MSLDGVYPFEWFGLWKTDMTIRLLTEAEQLIVDFVTAMRKYEHHGGSPDDNGGEPAQVWERMQRLADGLAMHPNAYGVATGEVVEDERDY